MSILYLNGEFLDEEMATLSPSDRGFLYGDGVFETIRASAGRTWFPEAHLARMRASCDFLRIPLDSSTGTGEIRIREAIDRLLADNGLEEADAAVRITVSRGRHTGRLDLEEGERPTILITARPYPGPATFAGGEGLRLTICRDFAQNEVGPLFAHKSLNHLFYLLLRDRARRAGFDDGIILNREGAVCECATSNLFIVEGPRPNKEPRVRTPALRCGLLGGIVRSELIQALGAAGFEVDEGVIMPDELLGADEVFCTNSLMEITPVSQIEEQEFADWETITRIMKIFDDHKVRVD